MWPMRWKAYEGQPQGAGKFSEDWIAAGMAAEMAINL